MADTLKVCVSARSDVSPADPLVGETAVGAAEKEAQRRDAGLLSGLRYVETVDEVLRTDGEMQRCPAGIVWHVFEFDTTDPTR